MELVNQTITVEKIVRVSAATGFVEGNSRDDLLKVGVFDRHGETKDVALGFVAGFRARVGAVGTTVSLDENTLMVVGINDDDMAICANTLIDCGGGMAVVNQGEILEKIAFPYGGLFAIYPWQEVGVGLRRIQRCLRNQGTAFDKPMYALSFLTFVTLPSLRITARGLIDVKQRRIVPLFVD